MSIISRAYVFCASLCGHCGRSLKVSYRRYRKGKNRMWCCGLKKMRAEISLDSQIDVVRQISKSLERKVPHGS